MDDSSYLIEIKDEFDSLFPAGWIDNCSWDRTTAKNSFSEGSSIIDSFRVKLFISLSKLILSGDYFFTETDQLLKELDERTYHETHVVSKQKLKTRLEDLFDKLLLDMRDCISLASHFITTTRKRFEQKNLGELFIAVQYSKKRENRHPLVYHFEHVLDSCIIDFELSYSEDIVTKILLMRDFFIRQRHTNTEIDEINRVVISKLEFLLFKLSYVSDDKIVEYTMDAQHIIIEPLKDEKERKILELRDLFVDYELVEKWKQAKTNEFIVNPYADSIQMWKAVMLMRYYTKKTKNINQIDNLLELTEKHYVDSLKSDKDNIVNLYANKTSRNYFYNSRFSFLCEQGNKYPFEEMKKDMKKIEQIQDETSVYNYHPYKKAFIYLNNLIQIEINEKKSEDVLRPQLDYLEYCLNKYKETLKWCKKNQPYILQLRFDFSTVDYQDKKIKVFYPSSMLRPLNFGLLDDAVVDFQNKLSLLKYSVDNHHYNLELLEARNQIKNIEKDRFKLLSFFSTIIIFLVGTITIFTGNNSNVTIFSKIEYVAVLGIILLLFVCIGYIAMSYKENNIKQYIFGFLTAILIMILVNMFTRMPDNKGEINVQDDSPIETTSNKKDFVKPSLNPSSIK